MKSKTIGIAAIIDKAAKSPQSCFVGDIKDASPTGKCVVFVTRIKC